jgi:hypothetical protein
MNAAFKHIIDVACHGARCLFDDSVEEWGTTKPPCPFCFLVSTMSKLLILRRCHVSPSRRMATLK